MIVQEVSEHDFNSRMTACEVRHKIVPNDAIVFLVVKPTFIYVNPSTNKTNPRKLHQRYLESPKVTVWRVICLVGIISPWFCKKNEVTVTVNSNRYVNMLQDFLHG